MSIITSREAFEAFNAPSPYILLESSKFGSLPSLPSSLFLPVRTYHFDRRRSCNGCRAFASAQRTAKGAASDEAFRELVTPQLPPGHRS